VSTFYALTSITAVSRIAFLITSSVWVTCVSDRMAVSSKLILELFQIAAMAELSIHIKVSAYKLSPEEASKKLYWVKFWLTVAVVFYLALNLFEAFAYYFFLSAYLQQRDAPKWKMVNTIILPFDYFSVSIGLCIVSIDLLVNMHKHFAEELQTEARRLKVIFLVLTGSYVSRAVVNLLASAEVIFHYYLVNCVMYILWDIVPLSLIMYYHHRAFTTLIKKDERKSEDLERNSFTSTASPIVPRAARESQPQPQPDDTNID